MIEEKAGRSNITGLSLYLLHVYRVRQSGIASTESNVRVGLTGKE